MTYSRDPHIPGLKYHGSIPYNTHSTRLQTLDIWLPDHAPTTQQKPSRSRSRSSPNPNPGTWLVYVHGGAWRDPAQDSLCALPTLRALSTTHSSLLHNNNNNTIAGIASLNYRLSPYPQHPTDPSTPDDTSRNATHPAHIQDVRDALVYLTREHGLKRWLGVGHSCGATLLLQLPLVCAATDKDEAEDSIRASLQGLVLLAGIYDVPVFVASHAVPKCPPYIADIYRAIVYGAFGDDGVTWAKVSPARFGGEMFWGGHVVLGYSREDELVEPAQRARMLERYLEEGWTRDDGLKGSGGANKVAVRDVKMGHDEVWEDGGQIADLIAELVRRVDAR